MTMHVVQYSGGIGSWAATQRVIAEHGTTNLVLLVADTRAEDPDLWRFVHDSTVHIGVEPTVVADGRTPFEVFRDQRFLVLSPRRHLSERETSRHKTRLPLQGSGAGERWWLLGRLAHDDDGGDRRRPRLGDPQVLSRRTACTGRASPLYQDR